MTIPVAVHVPPLARRQIEALDVDVPLIVETVRAEPVREPVESKRIDAASKEQGARPVRDRAPRMVLVAIGLAAGIALGWVAHSARTPHEMPTRADLR